MRVRYSRRALSQLASLYEYLHERNRVAANDVRGSIRSTIGRLAKMSLLGKMTDERAVRVIVDPEYGYRVLYTVAARSVFVIRILHGRQQ